VPWFELGCLIWDDFCWIWGDKMDVRYSDPSWILRRARIAGGTGESTMRSWRLLLCRMSIVCICAAVDLCQQIVCVWAVLCAQHYSFTSFCRTISCIHKRKLQACVEFSHYSELSVCVICFSYLAVLFSWLWISKCSTFYLEVAILLTLMCGKSLFVQSNWTECSQNHSFIFFSPTVNKNAS
jgi:hypothetical protein